MMLPEKHFLRSLFSSEQACITYLFQKRWPWGFKCPFCGAVQLEIAPAYTVVCRYCRKQTSITAHTLMHGSKKSLVAWMRVAWQFCSQYEGASARQLQKLMELSCYQTAWSWLQKIRRGAALAESAPCRDLVLFDTLALPRKPSSHDIWPDIGMALELSRSSATARVRLAVLTGSSPGTITDTVNNLVDRNATLLIKDRRWLSLHCRIAPDLQRQPTREQFERGQLVMQQAVSWLNTVYRRAIKAVYLQGYLDEFCFRKNTAAWPDHLAVLDHLLTGLMSTSGQKEKGDPSARTGGLT